MRAFLGDSNIQGYLLWVLVNVLESPPWREMWENLHLPLWTFHDLDLEPDAPDSVLWHACQQRQVILITTNRNAEGPDTLEAIIRMSNTPTSLPVFTLASPEDLINSPAHADRVAERFLRYLFEIDNFRGTGRLYLP